MTRKLRSNYEIGTSFWAVRRAQWRALGLTDADMAKPKIAVVNTSSELAICFSHLDGVAKVVKEGVARRGRPALRDPHDRAERFHPQRRAVRAATSSRRATSSPTTSRSRSKARSSTAWSCLASCDKTPPGAPDGRRRASIFPPSWSICGYQPSGQYNGEHVDIEDVFLHAGYHLAGATSLDRLTGMSENAMKGPGVCAGMGTANSMHMALRGAGHGAAGRRAGGGQQREDVRIRAPIRRAHRRDGVGGPASARHPEAAAFANAVRTMCAASASINTVKHLQAIATEARARRRRLFAVRREGAATPVLCAVRPNGDSLIEDLEAAGGARTLMKSLAALSRPIGADRHGQDARRKPRRRRAAGRRDHPAAVPPLFGQAGDRHRARLAGAGRRHREDGPALGSRTQDIRQGARVSCDRPGGRGDSRGQDRARRRAGARRARPAGRARHGHGFARRVRVDGAGLGPQVPFVTDGQLSGLVNKGLVVGEVSPEAATGGPVLSVLVHDGDVIDIDMIERKVDLRIDPRNGRRDASASSASRRKRPEAG